MKKWIPFLLSCFALSNVFSQENFFAFVDKQQEATGVSQAASAHKLKVAQEVFNALVEGQGDMRLLRPRLVMNSNQKYVAWARPKQAEIGLEELAYDICTSFGADSLNAIAALLTHELVHYYEKHEWTRNFVRDYEELTSAQQMKKLEEGIKLETQADYLGGFLAYSVGYDVYGVMPELLKKIYSSEAYDLPEEMYGYPSLQDRISMAEKAMEKLKRLQLVFDMGNYLSILEKHEATDTYYRFILSDFQSRGIYNNAGVNTLLSALTFVTKKEMPYALPMELDPKFRLRQSTMRDPDLERHKKRDQYLQEAIYFFDQALVLDHQYGTAFLNKAIAYVLMENWEKANSCLNEASNLDLNAKVSTDLLVLKGIIAAQQQNFEEARAWWQKPEAALSYLSEVNLQILQNGPLQPLAQVFGFAPPKEQLDDLALDGFLETTTPDQMIKINNQIICGFHQKGNSTIYSHSEDFGKVFVSVQTVDRTFTGKSMEGIKIGDVRSKLLDAYGLPERQLQSLEGEYLVYEKRNLFFQLNAEAEVIGWAVFRQR